MQRTAILFAAFLVLSSSSVSKAERPQRHVRSVHHSSAAFGNGITFRSGNVGTYGYPLYGFGYYQDAYASGRFKIPDPLNDPIFRAQHKFDSHFPGRRYTRPRLQPTYPSH